MMLDISNIDSLILQNVLDVSPTHIYWKNRDGVYLGANQALLKYFDFKSLKELLGKTDFDIIDMASASHVRKTDLEIMAKAKLNVIKEVDASTGNTFLSYKAPLRDRNNKIIGIVGHSIDITNEERATRKLVEQNYSFQNWTYKKHSS